MKRNVLKEIKMHKIIATAVIVLAIGATSGFACDMGEADNMCKKGQIFDPQSGECQDVTM